ncbi:TPA: hypothetical protein RFV54_001059 [Klebsiella aerogenes]|nr:hypothetical protein [Klebsiella aerogenes]
MYETYRLNFPIETEQAQLFWASYHKLNRVKAIIAFSLDEDNANDNLRRFGFTRGFREICLKKYKQHIGDHKMLNIPYSVIASEWYKEIK